jgi:hypothetical protein
MERKKPDYRCQWHKLHIDRDAKISYLKFGWNGLLNLIA